MKYRLKTTQFRSQVAVQCSGLCLCAHFVAIFNQQSRIGRMGWKCRQIWWDTDRHFWKRGFKEKGGLLGCGCALPPIIPEQRASCLPGCKEGAEVLAWLSKVAAVTALCCCSLCCCCCEGASAAASALCCCGSAPPLLLATYSWHQCWGAPVTTLLAVNIPLLACLLAVQIELLQRKAAVLAVMTQS